MVYEPFKPNLPNTITSVHWGSGYIVELVTSVPGMEVEIHEENVGARIAWMGYRLPQLEYPGVYHSDEQILTKEGTIAEGKELYDATDIANACMLCRKPPEIDEVPHYFYSWLALPNNNPYVLIRQWFSPWDNWSDFTDWDTFTAERWADQSSDPDFSVAFPNYTFVRFRNYPYLWDIIYDRKIYITSNYYVERPGGDFTAIFNFKNIRKLTGSDAMEIHIDFGGWTVEPLNYVLSVRKQDGTPIAAFTGITSAASTKKLLIYRNSKGELIHALTDLYA